MSVNDILLKRETASEHLRNALQLLEFEEALGLHKRAIVNRITLALDLVESCKTSAKGRATHIAKHAILELL